MKAAPFTHDLSTLRAHIYGLGVCVHVLGQRSQASFPGVVRFGWSTALGRLSLRRINLNL
jgi:hypothetical protein